MKLKLLLTLAIGIALGEAFINLRDRSVYAQGVAYQISASGAAGTAWIVSTNGTVTLCSQSGCNAVGHATP